MSAAKFMEWRMAEWFITSNSRKRIFTELGLSRREYVAQLDGFSRRRQPNVRFIFVRPQPNAPVGGQRADSPTGSVECDPVAMFSQAKGLFRHHLRRYLVSQSHHIECVPFPERAVILQRHKTPVVPGHGNPVRFCPDLKQLVRVSGRGIEVKPQRPILTNGKPEPLGTRVTAQS